MTTISSAATLPARPSVLGRLLREWNDAIVTYWMRREAIKALHELDDRSLRDIGIPRCHIEIAVAGNVDLELIRIR
ncbi:DUF1127 domain-containing protein [Bradyrhizobium sp. ISRA443]|uniref:DUF1127 domain-containing protein n=1 Tax=unclassified Bradyrhizobium TaxID=2631580 RepID=UPI00247963B6|nr:MULTISPECIES: DUF1127 domain-containing protein [unclassified Bradyrhizobium]WGR97326.1 DUF1127 domain-containing protein [Bradyrhizobium sp. ISRA436]WGS04215.1 DUF1127 domain-containing protein [Bradyrhizobium sp. ISRA437]WGS11098.1 DUF1127 domain-containing protein [Bradyrhizobium sp. ISRA443]